MGVGQNLTTSCPSCASSVDPLRAGHVAIFGQTFYYFCDLSCRERFATIAAEPIHERSPLPDHDDGGARRDRLSIPASVAAAAANGAHPRSRGVAARDVALRDSFPPASGGSICAHPSSPEAAHTDASHEVRSALAWTAVAAGILAISLVLAGTTPGVMSLRVALATLGWTCLALRAIRTRREPTDVHPALLLAPGLVACIAAAAAWLARDARAEEAATFEGIVVTSIALTQRLVERARQSLGAERRRIAEALRAPGQRSARGSRAVALEQEIKAGEETVSEAGDVVSVDGTVVAGEATVVPWIGSSDSIKRREGDGVLAGARVLSGKLRVRAAYTGLDRAWARLTLDPRRRADVHARVARVARTLAGRGGPLAFVLAGFAAVANGDSPLEVALTATAAFASIATAAVASMAAVHVGRGIFEGLRRGVAYRSAVDWDRAGDVSIAAFCARGTLLLGEPELADLEAVGRLNDERVLALAAGAESTSANPVAMAVQRAAFARRIRPDAVRSPSVQPGLGVLAVASTGETLTVGSRALMLREKISVAIAEQKIAEIEAHGREVLLVALAGKLVGVVGLQDGVRPGARAAVQHLLDAQVEPVLISGDSRETCEAIGRALDIDHIRPEVLLGDRAVEIERLAQGGLTVAVLGHPRTDEAALSAADVALAMPALGGASGEWGVMLASDDVRDGALALSLARRTKHHARTGLILALSPGILFSLAVAFGLLPAAYAVLAALLGALVSALHARTTDPTRAAPAQPRIFDSLRPASAVAPGKID